MIHSSEQLLKKSVYTCLSISLLSVEKTFFMHVYGFHIIIHIYVFFIISNKMQKSFDTYRIRSADNGFFEPIKPSEQQRMEHIVSSLCDWMNFYIHIHKLIYWDFFDIMMWTYSYWHCSKNALNLRYFNVLYRMFWIKYINSKYVIDKDWGITWISIHRNNIALQTVCIYCVGLKVNNRMCCL